VELRSLTQSFWELDGITIIVDLSMFHHPSTVEGLLYQGLQSTESVIDRRHGYSVVISVGVNRVIGLFREHITSSAISVMHHL
jgi:hypothetical protein